MFRKVRTTCGARAAVIVLVVGAVEELFRMSGLRLERTTKSSRHMELLDAFSVPSHSSHSMPAGGMATI